ncbi:Hypothetical protein AA314_08655 [Archangium gephyra]|uniref:Uncharacterized protein n=1 Tax=Archangium gephyra TaxID=48 RepID=A0AAC8QGL7_9BACT|nr:Hypothetical protein AA314_08655 [Archangium gephyra]
MWILRLEKANGKVQEYRCTSEGQAKQLALMLSAPASMEPVQLQA